MSFILEAGLVLPFPPLFHWETVALFFPDGKVNATCPAFISA
jgi:hypothetical protein